MRQQRPEHPVARIRAPQHRQQVAAGSEQVVCDPQRDAGVRPHDLGRADGRDGRPDRGQIVDRADRRHGRGGCPGRPARHRRGQPGHDMHVVERVEHVRPDLGPARSGTHQPSPAAGDRFGGGQRCGVRLGRTREHRNPGRTGVEHGAEHARRAGRRAGQHHDDGARARELADQGGGGGAHDQAEPVGARGAQQPHRDLALGADRPGRHGAGRVVGVHVHLPDLRAADDGDRLPQHLQLRAELGGEVRAVVGLHQVHHLELAVPMPAGGRGIAERPRPGPTCSRDRDRPRHPPTGQHADECLQDHHQPGGAGVHHRSGPQHRQLGRGPHQRLPGAAQRRQRGPGQVRAGVGRGACRDRRRRRGRQDGALDRPRHRRPGGALRRIEPRGEGCRVETFSTGPGGGPDAGWQWAGWQGTGWQRAGQAEQELAGDHARVATRAQQRAAGEGPHGPVRGGRWLEGGDLVGPLGDGQVQVGAGVGVGHREDVERVQPAPGRGERARRGCGPGLHRSTVQPLHPDHLRPREIRRAPAHTMPHASVIWVPGRVSASLARLPGRVRAPAERLAHRNPTIAFAAFAACTTIRRDRGCQLRRLRQGPRLRAQHLALARADEASLEPEHPARAGRRRRRPETPQRVHLVPQGRQGRAARLKSGPASIHQTRGGRLPAGLAHLPPRGCCAGGPGMAWCAHG